MIQITNYKEEKKSDWLSMYGSEAVGLPLVKKGCFGADILHFTKGQKTTKHTHLGNHILFVVEGSGYLIVEDKKEELITGTCYLIEGEKPHLVGTNSEMYLLSVGDNHFSLDSQERLIICEE